MTASTTTKSAINWERFLSTEVPCIIANIRKRLPSHYAYEAEDITYRSLEETATLAQPIENSLKLKNVVFQRAKWRLIDHMRSRHNRERSYECLLDAEEGRHLAANGGRGHHQEFLKREFWGQWRDALNSLDPCDRELLEGRHLHGESRESLAEKHDLNPATVGTRICRGLKKVRGVLEENGVRSDYFSC